MGGHSDLSDEEMPEKLLAQEHAGLTPIIIWTGIVGEDVAVECIESPCVVFPGCNQLVSKNKSEYNPLCWMSLHDSPTAGDYIARSRQTQVQATSRN